MLSLFFDKLIQFTSSAVDTFGNIEAKPQMLAEQYVAISGNQDLQHLHCQKFVVQCVITDPKPDE